MKTIEEILDVAYGESPQFASSPSGRLSAPPIVSSIDPVLALNIARTHSISHCVVHTCLRNGNSIREAVSLLETWMRERAIVRILGAGRALLAASIPANRLAHGGAQVSFMGGMVPLPNSALGGGIISASASGKTKPVLEAMQIAKRNNPGIAVLGIADHSANEFSSLCDVFIGIHAPRTDYPNPLSALADTEEYVISLLLDGLVVQSGKNLGYQDDSWRRGHEDIGPTGPYASKTNA